MLVDNKHGKKKKKVFDECAQSCVNSVLGNARRLEPDVLCYDPTEGLSGLFELALNSISLIEQSTVQAMLGGKRSSIYKTHTSVCCI